MHNCYVKAQWQAKVKQIAAVAAAAAACNSHAADMQLLHVSLCLQASNTAVNAQMQRQTAAESAAAEAEQLEMQEQEWNMAELERIQEQQAWSLRSEHCNACCIS